MRDSLTNRFRGAFLGMWLGETAIQPADWSLQTLAASNRWPDSSKPKPGTQTALASQMPCLLPELLPIALLYHDQPQQMHQALRAVLADQPFEPAAAVAQTLSLILRERFVADDLIPQLIRDLDLLPNLPLTQALLQVQSWLSQSDLAIVQAQLADANISGSNISGSNISDSTISAVALALYSFLSSPDHFQLSLRRLIRLTPSASAAPLSAAPAAGAMLGMISGLYGGLLGLPLPGHSLSEPQVNLEFSLLQQADQLLRQWAGAGSQQWQQPHTSLVAAPRIIRSG